MFLPLKLLKHYPNGIILSIFVQSNYIYDLIWGTQVNLSFIWQFWLSILEL